MISDPGSLSETPKVTTVKVFKWLVHLLDRSEQLDCEISCFSIMDMPVMRAYDAIPQVTNLHTYPTPFGGATVQGKCMSDEIQVGYGYSSSARPAGMNKQPVFLEMKGRPSARLSRFPSDKSSCDWISTPLDGAE